MRIETAIVGGGPAGAAAAASLAAAGRECVVLERTREPHHKVCGEFVSIETQDVLTKLGLDLRALGAVPIDTVSIHSGRRSVRAPLPFRALSVSRQRLDAALLEQASAAGAQVRRGVTVQSVARDAERWALRCDDGAVIEASNLVLATGKHGLRGIAESRDGSLVGLKMHLRLRNAAALNNNVALFLLDNSYVGLELVEDGIANLCLVMARDIAARVGPGWAALRDHLATAQPQLAAYLEGAEPLFDKPLAVVCPAGGHIHAEAAPAVYRIGDRLAHIPPFTGDGIAIAVTSGALAAAHIAHGLPPCAYLAAAQACTRAPIRLAGAISALAARRAGRAVLMAAAAMVPGLIGAGARATRVRGPALPMPDRGDSYAPPPRFFGSGSRP
jgi:flavin-dependent dehydrogenase